MNAPKKFLRLPDVKARTGRSRTAIYRDMAAGLFPQKIDIGPNAVAWDSDEIERWQKARIDQSRDGMALAPARREG